MGVDVELVAATKSPPSPPLREKIRQAFGR